MSKKRITDPRELPAAAVERRAVLKTIGAIALYGPVWAGAACDSDSAQRDMASNPAGGAEGDASPAGGSGSASGASDPGAVAQHDASTSGTATSSADAGAASDAGMQPQPDGSHVPVRDAGADAAVSAVGDAAAGGAGFLPPRFVDAPSCTLTSTDEAGEGPFFIHEDEVMTDPSLERVDMRDGKPGVELQLNYRLLDADGMCMKPIAGVEVYTWHTDALGFYSGFNNQNPDQTYSGAFERTVENGDRFCRGMQVTNRDGVVSFRTIYPGWYNGRPIHIHFVALRKGSTAQTSSYRSAQYHIFTTQLYFEEAFSRMIHEKNAPYTMRASGAGYNAYVKPNAQSMVRPETRMEGDVVVASLNIITKASGSRR